MTVVTGYKILMTLIKHTNTGSQSQSDTPLSSEARGITNL